MKTSQTANVTNSRREQKIVSSSRILARAAALVLILAGFATVTPDRLNSQITSEQTNSGTYDATSFGWDSKMSTQTRRAATESYKRLNIDRQKQLTQDSARLIELATSLKTEVDDGGREKLTPKTVQKALEIEKLARQVQAKMKIVYTP